MHQIGGWELATLQSPAAIHLALTLPSAANAEHFVADLRAAVAKVRENPDEFRGGNAGIYGMAASLPAGFLEDTTKVYLDTMTACPDGDDLMTPA